MSLVDFVIIDRMMWTLLCPVA